MQENLSNKNILSLSELCQRIEEIINTSFSNKYVWVKAEIHKLNIYKYSGHAYPELLEKKDNKIVCQMKGVIWKNDLLEINQKFTNVIGEPLKENINVLMYVSVNFSSRYGLNLYIKDIDPNYTLGELEKQKRDTIEKLKKEGVFEKNKMLELAIVPQRIAIISVETSKGYRDLITTFQKYEQKFKVYHDLYPSLLQGDEASQKIIEQLKIIKEKKHLYDAVLIIRGGGGETGLSCYNDYHLCKEIACFPIPVITGIGHSTNYTVAEMVAYQNGITPTDSAMIIIQKFENFLKKITDIQKQIILFIKNYIFLQQNTLLHLNKNLSLFTKEIFHQQNIALKEYEERIKNIPRNIIRNFKRSLLQYANKIKYSVRYTIAKQDKTLEIQSQNIKYHVRRRIYEQKQKIQTTKDNILQKILQQVQYNKTYISNLEKNINLLHPNNILKRGYSIIFDDKNKVVTDAESLSENKLIKIKFYSSEIETIITHLKTKKYEQAK